MSEDPGLHLVRPLPPDGEPAPTADALLRAVALGDATAFERLYPLVAGAVYGLAVRVVRDPHLAQDVAQEVLVDVWRLAPRFDRSKGSAMAWILTMAHRRSVDRVRREQSHLDRTARAAAVAEPADHDVVVSELENTWDTALVRRALDSLTAVQRQAIDLAYYQGYTYHQVGTVLGIPPGTAKTRIRDGLIRLRDAMGVESA